MPRHTTPRQPLSCENCRKRKVKCESKDSMKVPCTTCVRRGHAQSCYYKRSAEIAPYVNTESELLYRIRNLEDLLKQRISQSSQSPPDSRIGTTSTGLDDASSYVGSEGGSVRPKKMQFGTIITSPTGYQHFSPQASSLETSLVHEPVETVPFPMNTTNFPFTPDPLSASSTLLDILPPLRQCDELKGVFFEVFSPLFHILHDPTFDAAYNRFRADPTAVSLSWLALLFVVLAIAVTSLNDDRPLLRDLGRESSAISNIKKLSTRYRSAAMQCLAADQFLYQHNLQTVQTLILLIYAMNHANVSSWALLGMTWNIAVKIGCHVDPSRLGMGIIEGEERRRCLAALMMLHTIQNTCLGNIAPQGIAADVQLPADKDDDDLEDCRYIGNEPIEGKHRPTKMSYILYKFRLYKIAAEVCQHTLDQECPDLQKTFALDQKLASEEREHTMRFSGTTLPVYHIAHHYILRSYTHHLYLILHKASLTSQSTGDDRQLESRQRCKMSAITILEVHEHLYQKSDFQPYQWYVYGLGSFHAFLAVSVLTVATATLGADDPDRPSLLGLIDRCAHRFESMASRSDVCARAVAILHRVTPNGNPTAVKAASAHVSHRSLPRKDTFYPNIISPDSEPEHINGDTYSWTLNPELEALLFDMAPEQWMAPNSFTWDRWDNTAFV